jgi:hypothetical protein
MIKPQTITITRAEGPTNECNKPKTAASWKDADAILLAWSRTAPENGGYDKCDFEVVFEDGHKYDGRYDLVHFRKEYPDLAKHVRVFVQYLAGIPPHWMTLPDTGRRKNSETLARYRKDREANPDEVAGAKLWLETYDAGQ